MSRGTPTDLELMMYFDGELPEPRRSEVAAFVAADTKGRAKVTGLQIAAGILRAQAEGLTEADQIADRVMARARAENGHHAKVIPFPVQTAQPNVASMVHFPPQATRPANDNRRRMFTIGAIAMAAAAGIAVWTQVGSFGGSSPNGPTAQMGAGSEGKSAPALVTEIARSPSATPSMEVESAVVDRPEEEEHGVEVAAVDFGNRTGSIFYVPTGAVAAHQTTTTVVWVSDDAGDKP